MAHSHAKVQGQRSVGSEDRVETNGWTDGGDCITSYINAVGNEGWSMSVFVCKAICATFK